MKVYLVRHSDDFMLFTDEEPMKIAPDQSGFRLGHGSLHGWTNIVDENMRLWILASYNFPIDSCIELEL